MPLGTLREKMYAVIMAGGSGTRLWPCSRRGRPKQLLNLLSDRTMLREAYERVAPLVADERVFVVTNRVYADVVREQIPELPAGNVIGEPEGHGTAPCIGLAAIYLKRLDPQGVMAVLTADHYIEREEGLRRALQAAAQVAEEGHLVTLGIVPTGPATGYGYIRRGELLARIGEFEVYRAEQFTEKPSLAMAREFLRIGRYYWNSGMFVWKVSTILGEIERHMPRFYGQLMEIEAALGTEREREVLEQVWAGVEDEMIDYGVMERAEDVVVIPVDIGWSDMGDWATLYKLLPADERGNVVIGEHVGLDTAGSLIYGTKRLIATIGLRNMIVVETEDAVLVCPKERAQDVKKLVEMLKGIGKDKYL